MSMGIGVMLFGMLVLAVAGLAATASKGKAAPTTGSGTPGAAPAASGLTGAGLKVLQTLTGKASWFNHGPGEPGPGPADPGNSGQASGISFDQPGIAVYNNATLKGWWRVTAPNGHVAVVQQTDVGPAPWTGRVVDLTYSAISLFGYTSDNLTDNGQWKLEYLGQNKPTS